MAYAKAVKAADPTASVLFMCTENAHDLVALPNVECGSPAGPYSVSNSLTMAILKLAAAQEAATHVRLLDCVDMHYPFPGKGLGDTSALWDTTSTSVVPHVQGWINSTYPGTGICVSEYNVPKDGGDGNTPDATTGTQLADILGMYGRLGYQVASYLDHAGARLDPPAHLQRDGHVPELRRQRRRGSARTRSAPPAPTRASTSTRRRIRRPPRRRSG